MSESAATRNVESATLDIHGAHAALVAAQGLARKQALELRKVAIDHLRQAAHSVERAQRELEDTFYEKP